jgi:hypothetical protein
VPHASTELEEGRPTSADPLLEGPPVQVESLCGTLRVEVDGAAGLRANWGGIGADDGRAEMSVDPTLFFRVELRQKTGQS